MSMLIEQFFRSNMHLGRFLTKNEKTIRHYAIERYLKNCSDNTLIMHINDMLKTYKYSTPEKGFPKAKLIKIMRPYLSLYLLSIYGFDLLSKREASQNLFRKLCRFYKYNPSFGRKKIILKNSKIWGSYYIEDCIDFNETDDFFDDFETSHLEIL